MKAYVALTKIAGCVTITGIYPSSEKAIEEAESEYNAGNKETHHLYWTGPDSFGIWEAYLNQDNDWVEVHEAELHAEELGDGTIQ